MDQQIADAATTGTNYERIDDRQSTVVREEEKSQADTKTGSAIFQDCDIRCDHHLLNPLFHLVDAKLLYHLRRYNNFRWISGGGKWHTWYQGVNS